MSNIILEPTDTIPQPQQPVPMKYLDVVVNALHKKKGWSPNKSIGLYMKNSAPGIWLDEQIVDILQFMQKENVDISKANPVDPKRIIAVYNVTNRGDSKNIKEDPVALMRELGLASPKQREGHIIYAATIDRYENNRLAGTHNYKVTLIG